MKTIANEAYNSDEEAEAGLEQITGSNLEENPENACRICMYTSSTMKDPLIAPCKCSGTMRFIHLECLREWLRSKLQVR